MRYLAVLESTATDLAEYARCFNSDLCRITKLNEHWVLESSEFNTCSSPSEVFTLADATLSVVRRILSLYCGLGHPLTVNYLQSVDAGGQLRGRTIRASRTLIITSATAMTELTKPINQHPLATAIFECAQRDAKTREALKLYQDLENRWADVYDIIEFLGGPNQIGQSGLGTRKEAKAVKQTANYYRHLGRKTPSLLPLNPPTLAKASLFAKQALRRWIESRL
jgi:hypothetical protein